MFNFFIENLLVFLPWFSLIQSQHVPAIVTDAHFWVSTAYRQKANCNLQRFDYVGNIFEIFELRQDLRTNVSRNGLLRDK